MKNNWRKKHGPMTRKLKILSDQFTTITSRTGQNGWKVEQLCGPFSGTATPCLEGVANVLQGPRYAHCI